MAKIRKRASNAVAARSDAPRNKSGYVSARAARRVANKAKFAQEKRERHGRRYLEVPAF